MLKLFILLSIFACKTTKARDLDMQITAVYDGDTFKVDVLNTPNILGKDLSIRIYGIDTPEIRTVNDCEKKKAIKARDFLAKLFELSTSVLIENCKRGKYFRLICDVYVNQYNVADLMLKKKHAIEYYGGARNYEWCEI